MIFMLTEINVTNYGAVGDGTTDRSAAIKAAVDQAGKESYGGLVLIPPGTYLVTSLRLHAHVKLSGTSSWSFRSGGGSTLKANDDTCGCLLDTTEAYGCSISGLCLDGAKQGQEVNGIQFLREDFFDHKEEDTFTVEDCQIRNFTGAGLFLQYACCFSVRHSHIIDNDGDGIYLNSWDGFILDNWLSSNGGWGIRSAADGVNNAAMTLTANRVEWNKKGGFFIQNAKLWSLCGNFFDRCGGPAIHIAEGIEPTPEMDPRWIKLDSHTITVTGNIFHRNGADFDNDLDEKDHSHIRMHSCSNVTITGNTMLQGVGDDNGGKRSPEYGLVVEALSGCTITGNTMWQGYTKRAIWDMGFHMQEVIMTQNSGISKPD